MWFNHQVAEEHRAYSFIDEARDAATASANAPNPPRSFSSGPTGTADPAGAALTKKDEEEEPDESPKPKKPVAPSSSMERVDSSAMQSLAAYDSDEEMSPTGRRRRSSEARHSSRGGDLISPDPTNEGGGFALMTGGEEVEFAVPKLISESRLTENPEAPPSREGSLDPEDRRKFDDREDEFSPEPEPAPPKGHHIDEDHEFSDEDVEEPPPPSRPQFDPSPSPAPRSVSQSPAVKKAGLEKPSLPTTASAVSLVSYGAGEDEEMDQSRTSVQEEGGVAMEEDPGNENRESKEATPGGENGNREDEDVVDVDAYLEKAFEGKPVQEWSTGSEGGDSPASGEMLNPQDVQIPPAPTKQCPQELNDRFFKYFEQKSKGMDFNKMFQRRKDFRNPSIYEKLIEHFGIDEFGSNFPRTVFDPHGFKSADYYDKLAETQKIAMDKLEKDKRHKTADSTDKKVSAAAAILSEAKSRKSKWDNPSSGGGSGPHQPASKGLRTN